MHMLSLRKKFLVSNINSAVFNVRDIKKIRQMLNTLRQDPRVRGASFDAIDPLIKPQ